ncbi:hypothetical protein [Oceanobacillus massiliensis]|uniref:hypothetical protein n=1 Tax=Oceanobacillus massiliensis TaxID=1465765 RepID=UPI0002896B05|nr:hypothetical protein [Oceanobacillus massiliensis]
MKDDNKEFSDFSNVDRQKNQLIPEEFPEGSYGSSIHKKEKVTGKDSPWLEGQYRDSAYVFPDKNQHDGLPRQAEGAHPPHDEETME